MGDRRRRGAAAALAAVGTALAGALLLIALRGDDAGDRRPAFGAPPASFAVGIVANTQDTNSGPEQDAARALGVRILREEIRWPSVEPHRGRFDDRRYDRLVTLAAQRGIQILPLLFKSPPWLTSQDTRFPPSLERWQRFVRHVVTRYGPDGAFWAARPELDGRLAMTTWEVWNEPYYPVFSRGGVDPAAYARLVRATVEAGRKANPRTRYLAAAETAYEAADGTLRDWTADVFAADPGLGRLLGGLAVHPYTPDSPARTTGRRASQFARIEDLLASARRNGVTAGQPLWVTELGWSTCPECVSRSTQAAYWTEVLGLLDRPPLRGQVAAVLAYNLRDLGRQSPSDPLGDFGLLTSDGSLKPAAVVVRRAARARLASPLPAP